MPESLQDLKKEIEDTLAAAEAAFADATLAYQSTRTDADRKAMAEASALIDQCQTALVPIKSAEVQNLFNRVALATDPKAAVIESIREQQLKRLHQLATHPSNGRNMHRIVSGFKANMRALRSLTDFSSERDDDRLDRALGLTSLTEW